ncbi:hypothetical protein BKA93DRAFT_751481 [Sparassis latifolia]
MTKVGKNSHLKLSSFNSPTGERSSRDPGVIEKTVLRIRSTWCSLHLVAMSTIMRSADTHRSSEMFGSCTVVEGLTHSTSIMGQWRPVHHRVRVKPGNEEEPRPTLKDVTKSTKISGPTGTYTPSDIVIQRSNVCLPPEGKCVTHGCSFMRSTIAGRFRTIVDIEAIANRVEIDVRFHIPPTTEIAKQLLVAVLDLACKHFQRSHPGIHLSAALVMDIGQNESATSMKWGLPSRKSLMLCTRSQKSVCVGTDIAGAKIRLSTARRVVERSPGRWVHGMAVQGVDHVVEAILCDSELEAPSREWRSIGACVSM